MSPAEIEDLDTYATQNDLPFESVRSAAVGQAAFSETMAALGPKYGSSVVTAEWIGSGPAQARVVFRGSVPKGAMNLLATSPVKVEVVTSSAPSARDRDRVTEAAYGAAITVPGAAESIAYSDPTTGAVTVEVPRGAEVGAVEAAVGRTLERTSGAGRNRADVVR